MRAALTSRAQACSTRCVSTSAGRSCHGVQHIPKPFTASTASPKRQQQQQQQQAAARPSTRIGFFKFGKNGFGAEDAGIVGSQGRDDYTNDDVEQYFNYMGFLATEGTYDRMEALMKDRHPIDVILLLAAEENDTPKIQEILSAGADTSVKNDAGKTALEVATKPETRSILEAATKVAAA